MLIARDGDAAGLLSGGCLEADLVERAHAVIDSGQALIAEYDTRSSDDILWGIGLGCEGAMRILLTRLNRDNDYQPFAFAEQCRSQYVAGSVALTIASGSSDYRPGTAYCSDQCQRAPAAVREALLHGHDAHTVTADGATFLIVPVELPTTLLLLGAGPDAMPLVEIAALMGWHVTVMDHRPAYAITDRFPRAHRVPLNPAATLPRFLEQAHYDAAVVMSHHLTSDEAYLSALADSRDPLHRTAGPGATARAPDE